MELKDIKILQDMGFSLDEIKAVYFSEKSEHSNVQQDVIQDQNTNIEKQDQTRSDTESKKKDEFSELFSNLEKEVKGLKEQIYKQNSSETLAKGKEAETLEDILNKL